MVTLWLKRYTYAVLIYKALVDTVLAPIGAVVVNALSALTRATILVKKGGKPDSTPHLAGRDMLGGGGA